MKKICVLGLGYIGLPTASLLAVKGFKVHGVDVKTGVVSTVNLGGTHICEPELETLVKSAVGSGNLTASLEPAPADIFIIAVPTPVKQNRAPDISHIMEAARSITPFLKPGNLVILESTSPVGTTEKIAERLQELRPDLDVPLLPPKKILRCDESRIFIAHCPERVLPGQILKELINNDRIVGGLDKPSAEKVKQFYRNFVKGNIILTDARTAELTKLAENAFRDVNIAFANELSLICERLGINVWEFIELANRHPRVHILQPGPGVGGHCIAVDPWFIVHSAAEEARLIHTARRVNDSMPGYIAAKVRQQSAHLSQPVITCLGLTYKANIPDLRESPALEVVRLLGREHGGRILVVEPHISGLPGELAGLENVTLAGLERALDMADVVVLLVDHLAFAGVDREMLKQKIVIDTRGMWR